MEALATPATVLAALSRIAIEQGRSFCDLLDEAAVNAPRYQPLPDAPPLCFIHVPKTGGASVAEYLRSNFSPDSIAPARKAIDFEELRSAKKQYRLYAGHIEGWQLDLLAQKTQLFTILRDPLELAISLYHFMRLYSQVKRRLNEGKNRDADHFARHYEDTRHEQINESETKRIELVEQIDLETALTSDDPVVKVVFRSPLLRQFGMVPDDSQYDVLPDDAPEFQDTLKRQWSRAIDLLHRISVIGDNEDIETGLMLLAATRGWPAPPPLPRHNDYRVPTRTEAAESSLRETFLARNPLDFRFYDVARWRAKTIEARIRQRYGSIARESLDAHHARRFFECTRPTLGFTLNADMPWNGHGWGLVERFGSGVPYREIADRHSASTLVVLDWEIGEYMLFVQIRSATAESVEALSATMNNVPLERVGVVARPEMLEIGWRVPVYSVAAVRGNVEFGFEVPHEVVDNRLQLGRIGCVPAPEF